MGLNVRIYNVTFTHNYKVEYRTNTYTGTYTFHSFQSAGTTGVTIDNLEFDTLYYVKLTDLITGQYVITQIVTHDSKFYDCYDNINFTISASTCSCGDYDIQLIDLTSPSGNHSSVINGVPNSYYVYSGTTHHITGATFITTATTNPSTNVIYTVSGYTEEPTLIYFFIVHSDGFLTGTTDNCPCYLNEPKRQGGFEVKSICLCCSENAGYEWRPYEIACEKNSEFSIRKTITGLSSPYRVWYDGDVTSRVYVSDFDNYTDGNIYWFDPITATTSAHMNYYTGIKASELYNSYIDTTYRRIYLTGRNTAGVTSVTGLLVYDIDTNTHGQISYGSNTAFQRQLLFVTNNYIYGNNPSAGVSGGLSRFERSNPLSGTVTTIAYSTTNQTEHLGLGAQQMIEVKNNIWVVAGSGGNTTESRKSIGIFDSDFNYVTGITLSGATRVNLNGSLRYWQSCFYDDIEEVFYVSDFGSALYYRVPVNSNGTGISGQTSGGTAIGISILNRTQTKTYGAINWTIDPVTQKLYSAYSLFNSLSDASPIYKMYELDRQTGQEKKLIYGIVYTNLVQVDDGLPNSLIGTNSGQPYWSFVSGWDTDGTITIFNNTISGSSTGTVNVLTLGQYNINTGIPTGNIIPNNPYIDEYIEPYYDDVLTGSTYDTVLSGCPITYTLNCPTIVKKNISTTSLYYEINIDTTVRDNPVIDKIKVSALDSSLVAQDYDEYSAPFTWLYKDGLFTGLPSDASYTVKVEYLDSGATVLTGCT